MAWEWLVDVAVGSLDALIPSPAVDAPADPLRVRLWTLGGALALGVVGALTALLLFPPIPPAGFLDTSADAMTRARTWGPVGGLVGGLVLGAILGRVLGRRTLE
jgi:hypothetical protein